MARPFDRGFLKGAPLALRILFFNLLTGGAGFGLASMYWQGRAVGFAAGFAIGLVNVFWLLRIARKGVTFEPGRAGRMVARSYYLRFAATSALLALLISRGLVGPIPLVIGLSAAIFTTLGVMISFAFEEEKTRCTE